MTLKRGEYEYFTYNCTGDKRMVANKWFPWLWVKRHPNQYRMASHPLVMLLLCYYQRFFFSVPFWQHYSWPGVFFFFFWVCKSSVLFCRTPCCRTTDPVSIYSMDGVRPYPNDFLWENNMCICSHCYKFIMYFSILFYMCVRKKKQS